MLGGGALCQAQHGSGIPTTPSRGCRSHFLAPAALLHHWEDLALARNSAPHTPKRSAIEIHRRNCPGVSSGTAVLEQSNGRLSRGPDGHIESRVELHCADEEAAKEQARQFVNDHGHSIALWQRDRKIATCGQKHN